MSSENPPPQALHPAKPLRLWPGVVAAAALFLIRYVAPLVVPGMGIQAALGGLACALVILIWWIGFSRAPWLDRLGAIVVIAATVVATKRFVHPSIAGGMMGMMLPFYAIPALALTLVLWAAVSRGFSAGVRRLALVPCVVVVCGVFTLLRTAGMTGAADSDLHWRWTQTPEERLLAQLRSPGEKKSTPGGDKPRETAPITTAMRVSAEKISGEWTGFRGPNRDGVLRGVRIETDWARTPPVELWRRPVGPGWSSFATSGDLCYTQEQRGEDEVVACYRLTTGEPVWEHKDAARFWESNAGAGPRATPTLDGGRVYTFGATGIVNALDGRDGRVLWTRNAATDTRKNIPGWGFAGSPLVVDDLVVVAASGKLVAYERTTGQPRWLGPAGGWGYSSPHLLTLGGVGQIVLLNGAGAIGVAVATGKLLWQHDWSGDGIVQPAVTTSGEVLIGSGSGIGPGAKVGVHCVAVAARTGGWSVEERWTSNRLKPYFNDFVVHRGHAFGFDGNGVACVNLQDGERKWKGGRYGNGQLMLLADQDLLIVLSEQGDLALVAATADEFKEVARVPALKGKTWNHPVLAGDVLLVRNSEEMAAFRVTLKPR